MTGYDWPEGSYSQSRFPRSPCQVFHGAAMLTRRASAATSESARRG
jgi:hypothetical protein